MTKKILFVVDAQNDFINGSLAVEGAELAMQNLAGYIVRNKSKYDAIVFTFDFHPYNHCSFEAKGGRWPSHCIAHTKGAALYESIEYAVAMFEGEILYLTKGTDKSSEQYSVYENAESSDKLVKFLESHKGEEVDFCGIAGDFCVLNTIRDHVNRFGSDKVNILMEYTPCITEEGRSGLFDFINQNNIKVL